VKIAIASGKGGTGKTFISTNLAYIVSLVEKDKKVVLCDCDVEEPNSHIFLDLDKVEEKDFSIFVPQVDLSKCDECGLCFQKCRYKAILVLNRRVIFNPELCHGCGLCAWICPQKAIKEVPRPMGKIFKSRDGSLFFIQGKINVGEAMATPLIRYLKKIVPEDSFIFFDAPPGVSCPVVATIADVDFVLLVVEPTPFGIADFKLMIESVKKLNLNAGVVLNKVMDEESKKEAEKLAFENNLELIKEFKFDKKVAQFYANGVLVSKVDEYYKNEFMDLWDRIKVLLKI